MEVVMFGAGMQVAKITFNKLASNGMVGAAKFQSYLMSLDLAVTQEECENIVLQLSGGKEGMDEDHFIKWFKSGDRTSDTALGLDPGSMSVRQRLAEVWKTSDPDLTMEVQVQNCRAFHKALKAEKLTSADYLQFMKEVSSASSDTVPLDVILAWMQVRGKLKLGSHMKGAEVQQEAQNTQSDFIVTKQWEKWSDGTKMGPKHLQLMCFQRDLVVTQLEAALALKKLSVSNEPAIDKQEFAKWCAQDQKTKWGVLDIPPDSTENRLKALAIYKQFDPQYLAGVLADDYRKFVKELKTNKISKHDYFAFLKELDPNKEGAVSVDAYLCWLQDQGYFASNAKPGALGAEKKADEEGDEEENEEEEEKKETEQEDFPRISDNGGSQEVWLPATSPDGKTYYYNQNTRETSWENPLPSASPSASPAASPPPQTAPRTLTTQAAPRSLTPQLETRTLTGQFRPSVAVWSPKPVGELKPDWVQATSPEGKTYYYDCVTRESTFVPPLKNPPASTLPEHWAEAQGSNGQTYYFNEITKEVSWEIPKPALPEHWRETTDAQGQTYFYHEITKEVKWDRPAA